MNRTPTPSASRAPSAWLAGLAAAALIPVAGLAACGSKDDSSAKATSPASSSGTSGMAGMNDTTATSPMGDMMALGTKTIGDVKVSLESMSPETFYVPEGDGQQVRHAPTSSDSIHLMATLADAESGIRLPDATVTVHVTGTSGSVFDGPLYPMIGRGMGLHYGENLALGAAGKYTVQLVASPPRVGRHTDTKDAWNKTIRASFALSWDGKMAMGS